jgi:positive regulator of sigma E activity
MQDIENIQGTVVSIVRDSQGLRATVDVDTSVVCPRCASGKGCGAGIFSSTGKTRRIEAILSSSASSANVAEGDNVHLTLESRSLLRAAWIVYGWPLLGAATGALLANINALGDAMAAGAALAGLALGVTLARANLGRKACLSQFVPIASHQPGASGS